MCDEKVRFWRQVMSSETYKLARKGKSYTRRWKDKGFYYGKGGVGENAGVIE
ncbi:TPA: hypothetical protein MO340_004308 [Salmonella enterica subsp. salamae serovar 35:g,m,s,t:-]|nr:hypothetical protein [Salmonella enterica subsp. salamae serovar 35:g,m,s,t:-]HCA3549778.1 hypothetical protein [Salmonella enterica subsp. salamae serovar 35:g,m,s,t:-]